MGPALTIRKGPALRPAAQPWDRLPGVLECRRWLRRPLLPSSQGKRHLPAPGCQASQKRLFSQQRVRPGSGKPGARTRSVAAARACPSREHQRSKERARDLGVWGVRALQELRPRFHPLALHSRPAPPSSMFARDGPRVRREIWTRA